MNNKKYKYIYGPVSSWRLGSSLGIDPLFCGKKACSFDCIYCQLGRIEVLTDERKVFVPTAEVIEELNSLPPLEIDYITFSGSGEPTLAENLGEIIKEVRKIRKEKIAVLTNSSLLYREDVQKDLLLADFVVAKLDASSAEVFKTVNRPLETVSFEATVSAIEKFKNIFGGRLALQIMFVEENKKEARRIARIVKKISPDEAQINTPLRPCEVKPLPKEELDRIKQYFEGLNVVSVYEAKRKKVKLISREDTLARRGKIQ